MIEDKCEILKLKVLSTIKNATESHSVDYWKNDWLKRVCFGKTYSQEDVISVIDSLVADGCLANESYCVVTKSGENMLKKLKSTSFAGTEAELADNEVDAFNKCNRPPELGAETPIFRYISVENFYRLLEDGENALAHFSRWDDPFEGFVFKGMAFLSETKEFVDLHDLYSDYYGQCWTLDGAESDMRWRACACGTRGHLVRIESTVGKLFDGLKSIEPKNRLHVACRIGKVKYEDEQWIRERMENVNLIEEIKNEPSELLFIKRKEFESENEFRIVLDVKQYKDHPQWTNLSFKNGMAVYKVQFDSLVKSILADPCMPRHDFEHLLCRMRQKPSQVKVEQSTLFQWPNFVTQL